MREWLQSNTLNRAVEEIRVLGGLGYYKSRIQFNAVSGDALIGLGLCLGLL